MTTGNEKLARPPAKRSQKDKPNDNLTLSWLNIICQMKTVSPQIHPQRPGTINGVSRLVTSCLCAATSA